MSERVILYDTGVPTALRNFVSIQLPIYTVTVANTTNKFYSATNNLASMIYVVNESGGPVPAFSDGINWRRVTDRNIIS